MLHIMYNHRSGNGKARLQELSRALDRESAAYQVHRSPDADALPALLDSMNLSPEDILLILGGDGSMNQVIQHLSGDRMPTLMLLPAGSGNDFARGVAMRRDTEAAIRIIKSTKARRDMLDCGEVSFPEESGIPARRFMVSCGAGYDANVCQVLDHSRLKHAMNRIHMGKLAYLIHGIQGIFQYKKTCATISLDGGPARKYPNLAFLSCHNLPFEGGGFAFAPDASGQNGKLNICVFTAANRALFTLELAASLFGWHGKLPGVTILPFTEAVIHVDEPLTFHTDGEVKKEIADFTVRVKPACIPFLYSK